MDMDALLRAARERQQSDLEATVDVSGRLSELKATVDNRWWEELAAYREKLVDTVAWALSPLVWGAAEDRATARELVDKSYREAVDDLPELRRLSRRGRRRWLLNRTLEQVAEVLEDRADEPSPQWKVQS
jgi:hypothetical protein